MVNYPHSSCVQWVAITQSSIIIMITFSTSINSTKVLIHFIQELLQHEVLHICHQSYWLWAGHYLVCDLQYSEWTPLISLSYKLEELYQDFQLRFYLPIFLYTFMGPQLKLANTQLTHMITCTTHPWLYCALVLSIINFTHDIVSDQ